MRLGESAACLLFLALALNGQGVRATISGTVTDPDGAPVSGADVKATNEGGAQFQVKASASGTYTIADLPAGAYALEVHYPGLRTFEKKSIAIEAGKTIRIDARLNDYESLGSLGEAREFFAEAREAHKAPSGPMPHTSDGKPDFSGVWYGVRTIDPGKPDFLLWAEELTKRRVADNFKDLPSSRCLPAGITDAAGLLAFRIMQNPTVLAFLYEGELPRQIYLDGRKHPEESLSPFIGHSVGTWDGETLVVDTIGFNDKTWLVAGRPHTDKLHVVERYRRKDLGHLEIETTIDDPGAYRTPWTLKQATELAPAGDEIGQYVCNENNRDVEHLVGK
jgi:hypothetical protein